MIYTFEIPGTLPTLNEYVSKERTNRFMAAKLKSSTQELIQWNITKAPHFSGAVFVGFEWIRPNARSDKDNVAFAKKFVLDALQSRGVIKNDSWNLCTPLDLRFAVNKQKPRTIVTIAESYEELIRGVNEK